MILTVLCFIHETFAKTFIPHFKLKYETREAANRLLKIFDKGPTTFYEIVE